MRSQPLHVEGGRLTLKDYQALQTYLRYIMPRAQESLRVVEDRKRSLIQHRQELNQLEQEVAVIKGSDLLGAGAGVANIEGNWWIRADSPESETIIQVVYSRQDGLYAGILTKCGLKYFNLYDTVFFVKPVPGSPNSFSGTEFGYDDQGSRVDSMLLLVVKGNEMLYNTAHQKLKFIRR
jgi:hypothetical protein